MRRSRASIGSLYIPVGTDARAKRRAKAADARRAPPRKRGGARAVLVGAWSFGACFSGVLRAAGQVGDGVAGADRAAGVVDDVADRPGAAERDGDHVVE